MKRDYTGDDKCPKCEAIYSTDWLGEGYPDEEDTVFCLCCKHSAPLREFMDAFAQDPSLN